MHQSRSVLAAVTGAALLVGGASTVLAASGQGDRTARCEARLAALAERRGLSIAELEARFKARLSARVDAALRAGRISDERAQRLRSRIASAELCPPVRVVRTRLAPRGLLRAAAAYLDLRPRVLRAQLAGTSLAALARAEGKSVDGLEAAMLASARARLARAVASGRIGQARAERALSRLERRVERLVQKDFPAP